MTRGLILSLTCAAALAQAADYKMEAAGAPPAETAALNASLGSGVKVSAPDGAPLLEIWFVAKEPTGGQPQDSASFTSIPNGALLGVVRFAKTHRDRRGQTVKPGVYTMRYGLFPLNGDHLGVAPQRDFLVLSPAAVDASTATVDNFDTLMDMSKKASGTPHPLVFSCWKADAGSAAGLDKQDEDVVLTTKLGGTMISVIIVGVHVG